MFEKEREIGFAFWRTDKRIGVGDGQERNKNSGMK